MANIEEIKTKSIRIRNKIFSLLESLNLGRFYFECAIIFMKSMMRISYSAEAYYNLTEVELREIEKIEEDFLRVLVSTERGCPISQLYFEFGLYPARFEIMKMKIMFYQYILKQDEHSLIYLFLKQQKRNPVRGDWHSEIVYIIQYLNLNMKEDEI